MRNTTTTQNEDLTKLIVITGGPGAGKTAILEMAKKLINQTSIILPESASIVFGGGFWRLPSTTAIAAAQSAIFHVQTAQEHLVCEEKKWSLGLCDRGTLDGLAYWPEKETSFWEMGDTTLELELKRYHAVIHLRTPTELLGYNHLNPLRTESSLSALAIDEKIAAIWQKHPRYFAVISNTNFLIKAQIAIDLILKFQSECH